MLKISLRDIIARQEGNGYWISPDNHVYSLNKAQSHTQWLSQHLSIVKKHDESLQANDPNMFERAFEKGWIRVRMSFDESDMSQLIASVTAADIELLSTLPEDVKDVISSASILEFMEMPSGNSMTFSKEEMMKKLHLQKYANFKPNIKLSSRQK